MPEHHTAAPPLQLGNHPAYGSMQHDEPTFPAHGAAARQTVDNGPTIRTDSHLCHGSQRSVQEPAQGRHHSTILRHEAVRTPPPTDHPALLVHRLEVQPDQACVSSDSRQPSFSFEAAIARDHQFHRRLTPQPRLHLKSILARANESSCRELSAGTQQVSTCGETNSRGRRERKGWRSGVMTKRERGTANPTRPKTIDTSGHLYGARPEQAIAVNGTPATRRQQRRNPPDALHGDDVVEVIPVPWG